MTDRSDRAGGDGLLPRITLEGNCIVDDSRRQTIAKFDLYNGSREELQAVIDRANSARAAPPQPAPDALREADKDRLIAMMALALQTVQGALQHSGNSPDALAAALSSATIALNMEAEHWQKYVRLSAPVPSGDK